MSMLDVTRMDLHFFFSVKPLLEKYAEKSFEDQHRTIYSFDRSHLRDIISSLRNAQLGASGIRQLPRLLLIGLVSEYDVFLHKLIRAGIASQEGLVARIDRSLSLKELAGFSTIREASEFLIEREIDAILYEDHLDQIRALNKLDLLPLNAPSFG